MTTQINTEINPKTGLPALVRFTETLDGSLVTITFDECRMSERDYCRAVSCGLVSEAWLIHELAWKQWGKPRYFVIVRGFCFSIPEEVTFSSVVEEAQLMHTEEFIAWAKGGF